VQTNDSLEVGKGFVEAKVDEPSKCNCPRIEFTSHLSWHDLRHDSPGQGSEPDHEEEDHGDEEKEGNKGPGLKLTELSQIIVDSENTETDADTETGIDSRQPSIAPREWALPIQDRRFEFNSILESSSMEGKAGEE